MRSSERSSSAASARSAVAGRPRVRLPASARPGRRLRPDPQRRPRREAPPRRRAGSSSSAGARTTPEMLAHHYLAGARVDDRRRREAPMPSPTAARAALTDAGDRAVSAERLSGCRSRFFRAALDLLPEAASRPADGLLLPARPGACRARQRPTSTCSGRARDGAAERSGIDEGAPDARDHSCA